MTEFIYAVAVVIVAFTVNKFIERFINAPRLKVFYDFSVDTVFYTGITEGARKGIHEGVAYNRVLNTFSLNISNGNTSIAKGCRLMLLEIESGIGTEDGGIHRLKQQVGWSKDQYATGFTAAELPKGINLTALVLTGCYDDPQKPGTASPRDFVSLNLDGESNIFRYSIIPNYDYRLRFVVTAENAEPYHFECVIQCDTLQKVPIFQVKQSRGWYESPWYTFFDFVKSEISAKKSSF